MKNVLSDYLHGKGSLETCRTAQDFDALCRAVEEDRAGRLRWQIGRTLGILPWEGMPGRDNYLYALAQLRIDREEALHSLCPTCRMRAEENLCAHCGRPLPTSNPSFDEARYEELKKHESPTL